ncbi:unnamed protein product [Prunus armeniaca]|uniref:Cytochrome c-552/DMSO reductase-like haem-binding domain-containing protein n=1 Tax=Prunus armeniaca TaxID=36596 RepID=A0A6J5VM54_PRUAR|nr:unnamed protein product [Prunus armeniaca]
MLRVVLVLLVFCVLLIRQANSHEESGEWSCESDSEIRVQAEFGPGLITLDGHADDWKDMDGFEFSLLPALDPDAENELCMMAVMSSLWFKLMGDYAYSKGDNNKCPSVALMFQIGEDATYHSMGGCKEGVDSCTNKTCKGHEVDILHFSIGNAIPGRLYGGNPIDNRVGNGGDRFGHLVDLYAWNPHCRYLDGIGSSVDKMIGRVLGGTVASMFTQDVQFTIGGSSKMSVAFWYPVDGKPWHGSGHYSVSCDWVPLDISLGSSVLTMARPRSSVSAASVFALLLSVISLCASVFIGYWVVKPQTVHFTPMENL